MATYDYKGDGGPDGTILGRSATDLVGLHGKAPSDQRAFTASVAVSIIGVSSGFGFSTSAQGIALVALVNEIQALLVEKGLMAAS